MAVVPELAEAGVVLERLGLHDWVAAAEQRHPGLDAPGRHEQRDRLAVTAGRCPSGKLSGELDLARRDALVVAVDRDEQPEVVLMAAGTQQPDAVGEPPPHPDRRIALTAGSHI